MHVAHRQLVWVGGFPLSLKCFTSHAESQIVQANLSPANLSAHFHPVLAPFSRWFVSPVQVHVVRQTPFSLERDRTTAIQLEADMRRSPDNGGALSFRAWADGSVVYEARVYASDSVVSGGQRKGMRVEDAFVHVLSRSGGDEGEEKGASAAAQHVLVGGVEVWGRRPAEKVDERVEEPSLVDAGGGDGAEDGASFPSDVAPMASTTEQLRFVFVAR